MDLFQEELEQTAMERIRKFAKIAKTMGFEVRLGFSGGKDSQVCYDLCHFYEQKDYSAFRSILDGIYERIMELKGFRKVREGCWRKGEYYMRSNYATSKKEK